MSSNMTSPSNFKDPPLTLPSSDQKTFTQAAQVISLFKNIEAGRKGSDRIPWKEFQLAEGEYDEIKRQLGQDEDLFGFVSHKIHYDYSGASRLLFVRMLSPLHEVFLRALESRINRWLEEIRCGSDRAAFFAQKILPSGSAAVQFAEGDSLSRQSHHDPDSSFCHMDAHYPGIVIEISYSHKRKRLSRLAEDYLLGTDGGVRLVVALDIEYGAKRSRKATMSVWRSQVITTADGDKRRVLHEVLNDTFRDELGNPTQHEGLRLRLSDFAGEELTRNAIGGEERALVISTQQLCEFLDLAEARMSVLKSFSSRPPTSQIQREWGSETPPEELTLSDEARYVEDEKKVAKTMEDSDPDYASCINKKLT